MIFVDTSAFYALADRDDRFNREAKAILSSLADQDQEIATTNYVVVETVALLQRSLSQIAALQFLRAVLPLARVAIVDRGMHEAAIELFAAQNRRELSLVDCSSIVYMQQSRIARAFAFDRAFQAFDIELLRAGDA